MNKTIKIPVVSFDTAKKLKKLGFTWFTKQSYLGGGEFNDYIGSKVESGKMEHLKGNYDSHWDAISDGVKAAINDLIKVTDERQAI